jgi:hypothetical protein
MAKIPKYKTDPKYALKYALRKGILTSEHEKVFSKNVELAIEYAIRVKQSRLIQEVEDEIFNFYCLNAKHFKYKSLNYHSPTLQRNSLSSFFNYVKLVKHIPKEYEESLVTNIEPENIVYYANCIEKRLDEKYENLLLEKAISSNRYSYLVEYSYAIGCKLPEDMHNCLLCQYIKDKDNLVLSSYFINLKNIKNQLIKITQIFDKNQTINQIIEQM